MFPWRWRPIDRYQEIDDWLVSYGCVPDDSLRTLFGFKRNGTNSELQYIYIFFINFLISTTQKITHRIMDHKGWRVPLFLDDIINQKKKTWANTVSYTTKMPNRMKQFKANMNNNPPMRFCQKPLNWWRWPGPKNQLVIHITTACIEARQRY